MLPLNNCCRWRACGRRSRSDASGTAASLRDYERGYGSGGRGTADNEQDGFGRKSVSHTLTNGTAFGGVVFRLRRIAGNILLVNCGFRGRAVISDSDVDLKGALNVIGERIPWIAAWPEVSVIIESICT